MKKIRYLFSRLFAKDIDIQHKLLNLILCAVLVGGTFSMAVTLLFRMSGGILTFGLLLAVALTLWLANVKNKPQFAAILIDILANMILFPIIFLKQGGMYSGVPIWLTLGLIFPWLILKDPICYIAYILNALMTVGCVLLELTHPEMITRLESEKVIALDIIQSIVAVTCVFGVIFRYQSYVYEKQRENLMQQDEKLRTLIAELQDANRVKSTFLANMSHEIRTPINAVLGMDEMILRENDNQAIAEYASSIQSAGQTLLAIINDILDFSKIESGKLEIIPVEYELASLVNDSYSMIAMRAQQKNLKLEVKTDATAPSKLYGDEIRIRQVLSNLLTNAVKYTKEGTITLYMEWEPKGEDAIILQFKVKDTGIGIEKDNLGQIFDAFQRIEEKRNRNIEGTGLGLNITKQLLDLMDGTIQVQSEVGQGSEFCVRIPQKIVSKEPVGDFSKSFARNESVNCQYRESFHAPQGRILVVDDVQMNLQVIEGLLKNTQLQVDTALSGFKCLEMLKQNSYHLIFLDHMMPQMDGVETLRRIREWEAGAGRRTPVVMLTANALTGMREKYLEDGFDNYIAKPAAGRELEEMILEYLPEELVERLSAEPAPKAEGGFLQRLDFLDTESALMYCGGHEEIYREVLESYVEDACYGDANAYFEQEDWENYRIQIHSLKSTSLSIGAGELSEHAKRQEAAVKERNMELVKQSHEGVMREYADLLERIRQALAPGD